MATTYIDPDMGSGYDYDSAYDWEAGQQGTLSEPEIALCKCTGGTADSEKFLIDGWDTSAANYIEIKTDDSYRQLMPFPTSGNYYRLVTTTYGFPIGCNENYVRFTGLPIQHNYTSGGGDGIDCSAVSGTAEIRISKCHFRGWTGTTTGEEFIGIKLATGASQVTKVWNCAFSKFLNSLTASGCFYGDLSAACSIYIYNVTCYSVKNINMTWGDTGTIKFRNCICTASDSSDDWLAYATNTDIDYCASGDATADDFGGSYNRASQTFSFEDAANGDFSLTSSDTGALGYGVNLYNDANLAFQDDINGADRGGSGAQWDIGADEYVSAGTSAVPVFMRHYRARRQ